MNALNVNGIANLHEILQMCNGIFILLSTKYDNLHHFDEAWLDRSKVGPTRIFSVLGAENSCRVFSAIDSQNDVRPFFLWLFLIRVKILQAILLLPYKELLHKAWVTLLKQKTMS